MSFEVQSAIQSDGLADVLERVLDKGIVIAGDVSVSLVGIELLTVKLRLIVASVDKARELGINWWEADPALTTHAGTAGDENRTLKERLSRLEAQMEHLSPCLDPDGEP